MVEVGLIDWVLWLVYATTFFVLLFIFKMSQGDNPKYRFFLAGFGIKLVGGLAFALIYLYYYGFGDSFLYYDGSLILADLLTENPQDYFTAMSSNHGELSPEIGYLKREIPFSRTAEEWFMVKLMSPLVLLGAKSYLVVTLFTSLIAFIGSWKLYLVFNDMIKNAKWAFAAAFLVPSVIFWSSGLIKDTITLAALNYMIYILYFWIVAKKINPLKILLLILFAWVIFKLKSYILLSFLPSIGLIVYFRSMERIESVVIKILLLPVLIGLLGVGLFLGVSTLAESSEKYKSSSLERNVKGFHSWHTDVGGSSYSLGEIDYSPQGIASKIPAALNVTFFRPYVWESSSPVVLVTAVESLIFFFLFLRALFVNRFRLFKRLRNFPFLRGSVAFVLIFGFAVGFTSYNFGALARYKTPIMGFALMILLIANYYKGSKAKSTVKEIPSIEPLTPIQNKSLA